MKKQQLKDIIKPIVKECINEVLLTEGVLASVIAEVVSGLNRPIVEQRTKTVASTPTPNREEQERKLQETRKKMLNAVGKDAYKGVNVFEGTTPLANSAATSTPAASASNPLSHVDPSDPGVDIAQVFGNMSSRWGKIAKGE